MVEQSVGVHPQNLGIQNTRILQPLGHLAEVNGSLGHLAQVQARVADGTLQRGHQRFGGGLAGAVGHGGKGGIHDVHACIGGHEQCHIAGAGGVVSVQVDGYGNGFLQGLHQGVGVHGQQKVCHILDADGVSTHLLQLLRQLYEVGFTVDDMV